MEWNAAWYCIRIDPYYVENLSRPNISARNIAEKLIKLIKQLQDSSDKEELREAAHCFLNLVKEERNYLYHSCPVSKDGKSALSKKEKTYTIVELEQLAVKAFDCSTVLNKAHHGFLKQLEQQANA